LSSANKAVGKGVGGGFIFRLRGREKGRYQSEIGCSRLMKKKRLPRERNEKKTDGPPKNLTIHFTS